MKRRLPIYYCISCLMIAMGMALLWGCTEDDGPTGTPRDVHFILGSQVFSDVNVTAEAAPATRALPEGFVTYNYLYSSALPTYGQIQAFLANADGSQLESSLFTFSDVNNVRSWDSHIIINDGTYYIYGFMPKEDAGTISSAPYSSDYQNGAVLTINNLKAVSAADVCVIVGVKGHINNTDAIASLNMDERLGMFDYTTSNTGDYVYLLADHIYCGLDFTMKVDATYAALRTIKVRKLKLTANNGTATVKTVNATVTLHAGQTNNGTHLNPLSTAAGGSISIVTAQTGEVENPVMIYNNDDNPKVLTTTAQSFMGCFAPATNNKFILESVYDVYDRKGNLIRKDCTATNSITVPTDMKPGDKYTVNLKVKPTYLYTLSDPDLDNPTITITTEP